MTDSLPALEAQRFEIQQKISGLGDMRSAQSRQREGVAATLVAIAGKKGTRLTDLFTG